MNAAKSILFIDRDEDIRDYITSSVLKKSLGIFNVHAVSTLAEAESALVAQTFGAIIMDTVTPSLDHVVAFIDKVQRQNPDVTIIAMAGFIDMILDDKLKEVLSKENVRIINKLDALKPGNLETVFKACFDLTGMEGLMGKERYTVLIVDDDQEIVDLLKDHFKKRNCETIATQDPATVVDKLRNFEVKLMLLDLKMRRLDGFQVLDKIFQSGLELPPTIVVTGFLPKYQEKLKEHGIRTEDVVTKPFNFDVMENCINRKLGRQIVTDEVGSEYESKIYKKNRCRLGFVEDEQDLLKDLGDFFGERNYNVSCFANATDALRALKEKPVDVLFVDIKLPGMQGDVLIEELSKQPKPPIMIPISADPIADDLERKLRKCGCRDSLAKPFDIIELIEIVKTIAIEKKLLG